MSSLRTDPRVPPGPGRVRRSGEGLAVCVVDHQTALAEAVAEALRRHAMVTRALPTDDPRVAALAVESQQVDEILIGIDSDAWDASGLIRWAARRRSGIAIVAMSRDDEPGSICAALLAGARSWVPKHVHLDDLTAVLLAAARGESFLPPRTLAGVLLELARTVPPPPARSSLDALTERELDVLEYLALGLSRAEVAAELSLSVNTVRTHLQRALAKLGVHTRLEAVSRLLREGSSGRLGWPAGGPS